MSLGVVAYLALFATVGILFLLVNLVVGRLVRPQDPQPDKLEIYECGEPAVGSSFVQFDIRFYVVALLFIIFDVEVAFFFPWATVFGKMTHLAHLADQNQVVVASGAELEPTPAAADLYRELGVRRPTVPADVPASLAAEIPPTTSDAKRATEVVGYGARQFAIVTIVDIAVFFAILLVGFAYVWKRGDLNWVRAYRTGGMDEEALRAGAARDDSGQVVSA